MRKWYNPKGEYPKHNIVIDINAAKDALILRKANANDPADQQFDPETEMPSLWRTLLSAKMPVSCDNLMLFSAEQDPISGNGIMVQAKNRKEKNPDYGYAFTHQEIAAFQPKFLTALAGNFNQPVLSAAMLPYVPKRRGGKPRREAFSIPRVTAPPTTQGAGVPRKK